MCIDLGCNLYSSLSLIHFLMSQFSWYQKMFSFIARLPEVIPPAICLHWFCNHCTHFIDGWHKYSRETYVHLNIHDSPDFTILLLILCAAKFSHNLNELLALHIVWASPPPARYPGPSSEVQSLGLANLDPSGKDIFWPQFHPAQMHRVPEEECVGESLYLCALGISQTCGGRQRMKNIRQQRETNTMPGVRKMAAQMKTCQS